MKKWLAASLLLLFGFFHLTSPAAANGSTEVKLQVSQTEFALGERFDVNVIASEAANLAGISFTLAYNPAKLRIAQDVEGHDLIVIDNQFSLFGGDKVDKDSGTLTYPLLYNKPLTMSTNPVPVITVTFVAIREGTSEISLENIQVSNFISAPIQKNTEDEFIAVNKQELYKPPQSAKFDINAALYYARQGTSGLPDLNGDGNTDISDMVLVLQQIEPMLLTSK